MHRKIIEQARLHHLLQCFSSLYFGTGNASSWQGDRGEECYCYSDGQGNEITLTWNNVGLVALAFDHEFPNEYDIPSGERQPLKRLKDLPATLQSVAERAANAMDRLVTHGFWADSQSLVASDDWGRSGGGIDLLRGFILEPEAAVFGNELLQNWLELSSLTEAHGQLAISLVGSADRPVIMKKSDEAILLSPPLGVDVPTHDKAKTCAEIMADIEIQWSPEAF